VSLVACCSRVAGGSFGCHWLPVVRGRWGQLPMSLVACSSRSLGAASDVTGCLLFERVEASPSLLESSWGVWGWGLGEVHGGLGRFRVPETAGTNFCPRQLLALWAVGGTRRLRWRGDKIRGEMISLSWMAVLGSIGRLLGPLWGVPGGSGEAPVFLISRSQASMLLANTPVGCCRFGGVAFFFPWILKVR